MQEAFTSGLLVFGGFNTLYILSDFWPYIIHHLSQLWGLMLSEDKVFSFSDNSGRCVTGFNPDENLYDDT